MMTGEEAKIREADMKCEILIQNGEMIYAPAVEAGIQWTTERKGAPGKLTFQVVMDSALDIQEGNAVQFCVDGAKVFYGYIFKRSFDKEGLMKVTCYDQLRYFKNKESYVYREKTASQVLQMVCSDFLLRTGEVEDTEYVIAQKSEMDKTLFDVVQNALDSTLIHTRRLYVLYDDFGRICLKNIGSMKIPLLIDEETGQNFEYDSSIDSSTYNRIKLKRENQETGKQDVYITMDTEHINAWGLLQYCENIQGKEDGQAKADAMLQFYNTKTKSLRIRDAFGDVRIRAGTAPMIRLSFGELKLDHFMVCEQAEHTFAEGLHTMNLTLTGGEFVG